jgi:hypothetical protein
MQISPSLISALSSSPDLLAARSNHYAADRARRESNGTPGRRKRPDIPRTNQEDALMDANNDACDLDLTLPVVALKDLFRDGYKEALEVVCTPLSSAKSGDVVGLVGDYKSHRDGMASYPLTQFIVAKDDTGTSFGRCRYPDLAEDIQMKIAHGAMLAQSVGMHLDTLWHAIDPLEARDGESTYLEARIFPDFLLVSVQDYVDDVFEGRFFGEEIDQEVIEGAFLGVIPNAVESAHDAIEATPLAEQMAKLANCLMPIPDLDDPGRIIPIGPPDIGALAVK